MNIENKIIQTDRGGVIVDEMAEIKKYDHYLPLNSNEIFFRLFDTDFKGGKKIIYSIYPLSLEGVPMIGEPPALPDVPMEEEEDIYDAVISYRKNHPELEQPQQTQGKLSAEEMLEKHCTVRYNPNDGHREVIATEESVLIAMEEYTEQFNQPAQVLSDEEIEKLAVEFYEPHTNTLICSPNLVRKAFIEGFKASQSIKGNGFSEVGLVDWIEENYSKHSKGWVLIYD